MVKYLFLDGGVFGGKTVFIGIPARMSDLFPETARQTQLPFISMQQHILRYTGYLPLMGYFIGHAV